MAKFKTRMWAVFLGIAMMLQCVPALADEVATENTDGISVSQDFSQNTDGFDIAGTFKRVKLEDGNDVLAFPTKGMGNSFIGKIYDEPLQGRFVFSYDYFTEHGKNITNMWMYTNDAKSLMWDDPNVYQISHWQADGYFQTQRTTNWHRFDINLDYKYEAARWYHCEVWIDTINREMAIYLDNDLVVRMEIPDGVKDVRGFGFRLISCTAEGFAYLDNLTIRKMADNEAGRENPLYIKATALEGVYGNNFTKDNLPTFNLDIVNRLNKKSEVSMYYKATTSQGKEVWNTKDSPITLTLEPNETLNKKVVVEKEYFGRLDLDIVTVIDGKEYIKTVPYTFINRSIDMPKNEHFGVGNHLHKGRGNFEDVFYALKASGIGSYRDSLIEWRNIEQQKGVYTFTDEMRYWLETLENNDIWYINQIGAGNYWLYNDDPVIAAGGAGFVYLFPTTKEGLTAAENAMAAMVTFVPGGIDAIGVWNEYQNMSGPAFKGNYKYLADFHKAVYKGVKKGNPEVEVSGMENDWWGMYVWDDLNKVLEFADGAPVFDALSIHTYSQLQAQPEKGTGRQFATDARSLLEKYGLNTEMDINVTEVGWSEEHVNFDRELHAAYTVRNQAWHWAYDVGDRICNYNLNDYPEFNSRSTMREARFGIMESYCKEGAEVPYLGKEAFAAAGYYNNLMADAEFLGFIDTGYTEEQAYAYRFRHRDGGDVLMMGPVENESLKFDLYLGANSVIVGDKYGNEKEVFGIDGHFNFLVGGKDILYVRGSFGEITKGRDLFNVSDLSLEVPINYEFDIDVKAPVNFEGEVRASNLNLLNKEAKATVISGNATIKSTACGEFYDGAETALEVYDQNGKLHFFYTVPITYTTSGQIKEIRWRPVGSGLNTWDLQVEIENVREDIPICGTVETNGLSYTVPEIAPKEARQITVPLPSITKASDLGKFSGVLKLTSGDEVLMDINETMTGMVYTTEKPAIDGVISDGEWDVGVMALRIDSKDQLFGPNLDKWSGLDDASMDAYLKYDDENFYVAAVVKDDFYRQINPYDKMWNGDSLQVLIGFDFTDTGTQYGIGLADGTTPTVYRNMQEDNLGGFGGEDAKGIYTDGEVAIKRNGEYTIYEASFPWDKIKYGGGSVLPGQRIAFSILYNDDDGNNRENWIEYANNCIGSGGNRNFEAVSALLVPSGVKKASQ